MVLVAVAVIGSSAQQLMRAEDPSLPLFTEPVALATDVQHVAVMQQPVQGGRDCPCETLRSMEMDHHMKAALDEARQGAEEGGIPIGVALVDNEGNLVATGRNRRVQDRAVVMHAETNCLLNAGKLVDSFRGMTLYSTLMPCNMCAGAIVQFGIARITVGEAESFREHGLNLMLRHGIEVIDLDLDEAKDLLARFIEKNPAEWHGDIGRIE